MQKVEGSNPFSRFFANPLPVGGVGSARDAETKSNHPLISPLVRALMPISARNGPDARRLAPIRDTRMIVGAVLGQLAAGANLPQIAEDLEKGAIVSRTRNRMRIRELPIPTSDGSRP
jgi:hypothetical protein